MSFLIPSYSPVLILLACTAFWTHYAFSKHIVYRPQEKIQNVSDRMTFKFENTILCLKKSCTSMLIMRNIWVSDVPEQCNRYEIVENEVYLGLGYKVGNRSWHSMKKKGVHKFSKEIATVIWKNKLANICLDYGKLKTKNRISNRGPVKLANARKLELYLSLVKDYIDDDDRYKHDDKALKTFRIKQSTRYLSEKIRDDTNQIRKYKRRRKRYQMRQERHRSRPSGRSSRY